MEKCAFTPSNEFCQSGEMFMPSGGADDEGNSNRCNFLDMLDRGGSIAEINAAVDAIEVCRNRACPCKLMMRGESCSYSVAPFRGGLFNVSPHPTITEQCDVHSTIP